MAHGFGHSGSDGNGREDNPAPPCSPDATDISIWWPHVTGKTRHPGTPQFPFNTRGTTVSGGPRVAPALGFAALTAAIIAWALRDHARFLPTGAFVPRHALLTNGHHATDYVPPAPVTGEAVINYPGLIMLAIHLTAAGILAAAWLVRRHVRDQVKARLSFAVLGSLTAGLVTIPVAAITLGNAILFTGTLAAAMTVLQYTFVLVVAGTTLFGVP
ncbi:hypothetical protein [Kibdelosporangium philippinense]|uniref:hypothetical protein n=1 Tax=Kibdelosporangium philippinense TaxID=211113 RepID=UPI0036092750